MPKHLLICTDLDCTLLPNGRQPESPGARAIFTRMVSRPEVTLAYVSGRHRELVEDAIREYELPLPDWVIGDVGTTIYQVRAGAWLHWSEWEQEVSADWRGLTANNLRPLFTDLESLRLQEESKQNRYKLSFYVSSQTDIRALQREMSRRLNLARMAASLIYSVDEASATGLLDVLPALATKLHAVDFLMRHQGFDFLETHAFLDRSFHPHQANAVLVFQQFTDGAHAAVAQVVDVIDGALGILEANKMTHGFENIFTAQRPVIQRHIQTELQVELQTPHFGQVIMVWTEK